jgi:hypothetical protein
MPRYVYAGDEPQTYPQYLNAETGTTLVAEPGESYDITQVEGLTVPGDNDEDGNPTVVEPKLAMPPDGRWTEVKATRPRRAETTEEN